MQMQTRDSDVSNEAEEITATVQSVASLHHLIAMTNIKRLLTIVKKKWNQHQKSQDNDQRNVSGVHLDILFKATCNVCEVQIQ